MKLTGVQAFLTTALLIAAALHVRDDQNGELTVQRLTVRGKDGKAVARLEETLNGPALALFDGEQLKTTLSDKGLVLFGEHGIPRLTVQDLGEGGMGIAFLDDSGRINLTLRSGNGGRGFGGESGILFYDEDGCVLLHVTYPGWRY